MLIYACMHVSECVHVHLCILVNHRQSDNGYPQLFNKPELQINTLMSLCELQKTSTEILNRNRTFI